MTATNPLKHTTPVIRKDRPDDNYKFRPLPPPTGAYPYHLSLNDVIPGISDEKITFHMLGDTGSVRNPDFQQLVTKAMAAQYHDADQGDEPSFLYHLGDVVYNFGEAQNYHAQFFKPYETYPGIIMAIPGNHDADVNPDLEPYNSLDAFRAVFCDTEPRQVPFSKNAARKSMMQPNIYWVLLTPLATIIGLYCNIPKYGVITDEQKKWFKEQLTAARALKGKALIVCLHHSPYSADVNHSSSLPMIEFLENAFEETGVRPDIVFSGHVHNYQRFHKTYADGKMIAYIVAGGGGFDELNSVALTDDERYTTDHPALSRVELKSFCDTTHGFLKITLERTPSAVELTGKYYSISRNVDNAAILTDSFKLIIE